MVLSRQRLSTGYCRFEMNLSYKLERVVSQHWRGQPVLVFCNSRKAASSTATVLARAGQAGQWLVGGAARQPELQATAVRLEDPRLRELAVQHGLAWHHAGLSSQDRRTVEQMFSAGLLGVLACTSTLALGVNLPAATVVIKSTQQMVTGCWREVS